MPQFPSQQFFTLAELTNRWSLTEQHIIELLVSGDIWGSVFLEDSLVERVKLDPGKREASRTGEERLYSGEAGVLLPSSFIAKRAGPVSGVYEPGSPEIFYALAVPLHIDLTDILIPADSVAAFDKVLAASKSKSILQELEHQTPEMQLAVEAQREFWNHERIDRSDPSTWPKQSAVTAWFEKRLGPNSGVRSRQLASSISPLWARKPGRR